MPKLVGEWWDGGVVYRFEECGKYVTVSVGRSRVSRGLYRKIEEQAGRILRRKDLKF